jgi:ankyrin repeat protein
MGCKIDEEDLYGQTPIYYAASENRLNLLDLFTPESMVFLTLVVNHVDKLAKQTPLFYAARKGHLEMCKALI